MKLMKTILAALIIFFVFLLTSESFAHPRYHNIPRGHAYGWWRHHNNYLVVRPSYYAVYPRVVVVKRRPHHYAHVRLIVY